MYIVELVNYESMHQMCRLNGNCRCQASLTMVCIPVVDMDYIPGNSLCSEMHRSMNPNLKKIELFIQ